MSKQDDKFAPGQTDDTGRPLCGARKKNGDPCGASPKKGYTRCFRHGGAAPAAKRGAKRRKAETAAREILGTIDPDAPREHPVETLLNLIRDKSAEVQWLRAVVKEKTEEELFWHQAEHQDGIGPMGVVDVKTYKAEMDPSWQALRAAEKELANMTTQAARAGVEERAITLNEQHAMQLVTGINRILAQLKLSSEQQRLVPEIVPQVLRDISGEAVA